ncbi:MAG: FCD domain-containing protein [Armatimonadota bacterium]|nr:FCD domain-containing protein [Armatimonadota bacterium]MDR7518152.1 FCD domain-containing protein [Armatimonadota bacterium]MDR7550569.1 FCD domain-containing protein [Armatimonadota bacterium]
MTDYARLGDVDRFFQANAAFHALIVDASGNERLRAFYRQLANQMRRYRMRSLGLRGGMERSLAEHAAILDAIERKDAAAAAQLMAEHIQVPQRILQAAPEDELVQVAVRRGSSGPVRARAALRRPPRRP